MRRMLRPTYDYLVLPSNKRSERPWPLTLALMCYDKQTGSLLRLPRDGDAMGQNEIIMSAIALAYRLWSVLDVQPGSGRAMSDSDRTLLAWMAAND